MPGGEVYSFHGSCVPELPCGVTATRSGDAHIPMESKMGRAYFFAGADFAGLVGAAFAGVSGAAFAGASGAVFT